MSIGYHSNFMDRIIERADKRQERMEKMINKMLDKSEEILQAGQPHEQTNEEWFCQLPTGEKAKWLENKMTWAAQEQGTFTAKGWAKWLKQPHTESGES